MKNIPPQLSLKETYGDKKKAREEGLSEYKVLVRGDISLMTG